MTILRRLVCMAAVIPLLWGCSVQEAPVVGALDLRIDQHAEFELLPPEDLFKGFGANFSLSASLALPAVVPTNAGPIQGRLTRFECSEPAAFPAFPFTVHEWHKVYPRLRPRLDGLQDAPLELTFGEDGSVDAAMVPGPNATNLLTSGVIPSNAEALLEDHMPGGLGMPFEKSRILDALARRWKARFAPEPLGELIGRHIALPRPEADWTPGAQVVLDGVPMGDLSLDGSMTYTVKESGYGRARLDLSARVSMAPRQDRLLLPLGIAEPAYEGQGAGWAIVDTQTNRIVRQFLTLEGSGVFEVLMVKHQESIPFTFRVSLASELEPRHPGAEESADASAQGAATDAPATDAESGAEAATPQNGA